MPNFDKFYPPRLAEDGKFVPLTPNDLKTLGQTMTADEQGRFALLTYSVGGTVTTDASGGQFTLGGTINTVVTAGDIGINNTAVPISGEVTLGGQPIDVNIVSPDALNVFVTGGDIGISNTAVPVSGSFSTTIDSTLNVVVTAGDIGISNTAVPVSGTIDATIVGQPIDVNFISPDALNVVVTAGSISVDNFPTDFGINNTAVPVSGTIDATIVGQPIDVNATIVNPDALNVVVTAGDIGINNTAVPISGDVTIIGQPIAVDATIVGEPIIVSVDSTLNVVVTAGDIGISNTAVPVSGNIDVTISDLISAKIVEQPVSVSLDASMLPVSDHIHIDIADDGLLDAFGRLRVAEPTTIFDSKQLREAATTFFDQATAGDASIPFLSADSSSMHVVSGAGDYAIRQTFMRFNYQPGKSQLILLTGVLGATTPDVIKRVGYYNTDTVAPFSANADGLYFEDDGINLGVVRAKNGTTEFIAQSAWNIDTLDGTGISEITLDITKAQIFVIDYEWLGVGRARFGFFLSGEAHYCHRFVQSNTGDTTYMRSPNHSCRYELRSTGGAANDFRSICTSVISEGGKEDNGILRVAGTAPTDPIAVGSTAEAIIGIRFVEGRYDATIIPFAIQILNEGVDDFRWFVSLNPTMNNSGSVTWTTILGAFDIEKGEATTENQTITDEGLILAEGYVGSQNNAQLADLESALRIGVGIDGTRDELWFCAQDLGGGASGIHGTLNFRELV